MKRVLLLFLKKNWFKLGIALFLLVVAFQDDLRFNINLNKPTKQRLKSAPARPPAVSKQEILSEQNIALGTKQENRFNLQPFLPSWRKKTKAAEVSKPVEDKTKALAKLAKIDPIDIDAFIKRFAHVAIAEQKKYGIPASITIGNGLLLSTANHSVLAQDHNNFYKLPCTTDWEGSQIRLYGKCYRNYETAWLSFRDHSNYLALMVRIEQADLDPTDYKAWANFLDKQDFSEEKGYKSQLIQLIQDLELFYLDQSE
jgi:flagellum-specific peptidoglycan hydrolase FlgJ